MMLEHLKIEVSCLLCILCVLSSAKGSFECANISNLTRISASSVLVEWQSPLSVFILSGFNLTVFENSSLVHEISPVMNFYNSSNQGHAYLINSLTTASQDLCFTVEFENRDPLTTQTPTTFSPSSGDYNESVTGRPQPSCRQECLPVSPQVPDAPQEFSATYSTTTSSSEVVFSWRATKAPVILACTRENGIVPAIIRELCGTCSPIHVGEFEHVSQYTCTLSEKNGVIVGLSSTFSFTTDVQRLAPPNFFLTSVTSTSITVVIQNYRSQFQYRICTQISSADQAQGCTMPLMVQRELTRLTGLYPFTTYDVQVQVRESGSNEWSYSFNETVRTFEEAPGKITFVSASLRQRTSTIYITWTPPVINNGSITLYMYCWQTRLRGKSCENTTSNSTVVDLDVTGIVYSVNVTAYTNGGGPGPSSDHVYLNVPDAGVPSVPADINIGDRTASYIQLKFKGLYNCLSWMANPQTLGNDIINDLSAQISNLCGCNIYLNSLISDIQLQCISNDSAKRDSDEFIFHALFGCDNCQERAFIEQWFSNLTSGVTVSRQSLFLVIDRSCPLYATLSDITECMDSGPGTVTSGTSGGAVAGALIGGILIGAILAVGIGLGIFFLVFWLKRRRGRENIKMMNKVDANSEFPLSTRYISADKNTHQPVHDDYEPITAYTHESVEEENPYEPIGQALHERKSKKGLKPNQKKQKSTKSSSKEHSEKRVMEDEAGYVVPDVLWAGKKRPTAPTAAGAQAADQSAITKTSSKANTATAQIGTTGKVEYDVPERVEVSASRAQTEQRSKIKGQTEQTSTVKVQNEHLRKQFSDNAQGAAGKTTGAVQVSTSKGHQKKPNKLSTNVNAQQEQPSKARSIKPDNEAVNPVQTSSKPVKKSKPKQQQPNPSELARQYQSGGANAASSFGASTSTTSAKQSHGAVKSKLQNILTPPSSAHTPLSRQTSSSAVEKVKPKESLVKAMTNMLEGGGGQAGGKATSGSETQEQGDKTKKKPLLPKPTGTSEAAVSQAGGGAESSKLLPTKKPKPLGKGTANVVMKTNKAYENWSKDNDASNLQPTQNPRGGGRGMENLYHF